MDLHDNIILELLDDAIETNVDLLQLESELSSNDFDTDCELILIEIGEFTVKQLMLVCEYYGMSKGVKMCKFKKNDIIESIILFETNIANKEIVLRRRELWGWMNQIKKEKVLKKCIIWPITN
jgi:hypothetical protein